MGSEQTLPEWRRQVELLGEEEFTRRLRVQLVIASQEMVAAAKVNATTRPRARSGRLRNSLRGSVRGTAGAFSVSLRAGSSGSSVVYAGSQEFGATIRPKVADFLRIPLSPALTPAGVDRFGGSLRSYSGEGFFSFKSQGGGLFIGKKGDEVAPGVPRAWYALVREVTIPRTLFMGRAVQSVLGKLQPKLADVFNVALRSTVKT